MDTGEIQGAKVGQNQAPKLVGRWKRRAPWWDRRGMGYQGGDTGLVVVVHDQQKTKTWDGVSTRGWGLYQGLGKVSPLLLMRRLQ